MEQQHGLLVVDKPAGLSSARCSNRFKRLGQKKIGHAGTLDPMARGVLLILLGHATKISGHLMAGGRKVYVGTVLLGRSTDTWDADGEVIAEAAWDHVTLEAVRTVAASWEGVSEQAVPPISAAKHCGQPLYRLSRAGRPVPEKKKIVEISRVEVLGVDLPRVTFRIECSSGTYIRSLAHSLGMRLGCGAVLTELIREYSHPFGLDAALPLEQLLDEPELFAARVLPVTAALPDWPVITVGDREAGGIMNGIPLSATASEDLPESLAATPESVEREERRKAWRPGAKAVLLSPRGAPLALVEAAQGAQGPVWTVLRGLWS